MLRDSASSKPFSSAGLALNSWVSLLFALSPWPYLLGDRNRSGRTEVGYPLRRFGHKLEGFEMRVADWMP